MPEEIEIPKTADGHIDFAKWEKDRPQREAERIAAKAVEAKSAETKPPQGEAKRTEGETPRLPRSTVRELNKLRTEAAEERGRRLALEDLQKGKPEPKSIVSDDPEPLRKDFATDAEYGRAAGRWDARQEAKKLLESKDAEAEKSAGYRTLLNEADEKFKVDKAAIEDWDAAVEEARENPEQPEFVPAQHPILFGALAVSDVRAYILHYWAKNPLELQKLLDMSPTKEMSKSAAEEAGRAQARAFNKLEGRVETVYSNKQEKKEPEKKKALTAAEVDAKLPKPSEAIAPKGGTPTDGQVSRFLADGVTVNPVYMSQFMEKRFGRQR